jgi:hypothetical protein
MNTSEEWYQKCITHTTQRSISGILVLEMAKDAIEKKEWTEEEKLAYWQGYYEHCTKTE